MIRATSIWRHRASMALLIVLSVASMVHADSWRLPTPESYLSADKTWRLTVTPRALHSQLAYFEDKVARRDHAGSIPGNLQKQAQGYMEHLDHGHWVAVWNEPLVNDVAPVSAIVSATGQVVTFDNWASMGYGDDAVVIYDLHGKPMRVMGLKDFLPAEYIEALPRSVSSLWWGGPHRFSDDARQLILRVVIPDKDHRGVSFSEDDPHLEIRFDLQTGKLLPLDDKVWPAALASAREVNAENRKDEAIARARFIAPLTSPHGDTDEDWHRYLIEAFFRLDSNWKDDYPQTKVLRLPQRSDYQVSVGFLRDALHDTLSQDGALMIASPSQDNLVRVLTELGPRVPRGWLKAARVYVAVDNAHKAAAAKALARSGARFIQLDPGKPIPQNKERLDAYLSR